MKQKKYAVLIILLIFNPFPNFAQNKINTSFEYSNHSIIINYEFKGDTSYIYDISILLKRTSDVDFSLKPILLSGDFGEGKYSNKKREIVWHLTKQEEENLTADDYYFEVTANEIKKSSGVAWYYYIGGAIVGGTAALLLLNKKSETPIQTVTNKYPLPPSRPD